MKRKEYISIMVAGHEKCPVVNFAPACFVIDVLFL